MHPHAVTNNPPAQHEVIIGTIEETVRIRDAYNTRMRNAVFLAVQHGVPYGRIADALGETVAEVEALVRLESERRS